MMKKQIMDRNYNNNKNDSSRALDIKREVANVSDVSFSHIDKGKARVAFLISGGGATVEACLEYIEKTKICVTSLLVFESISCPAFKRLAKWDIPKYTISGKCWKQCRGNYSNEILRQCSKHNCDWIFMMFNKLVQGDLLKAYPRRIINLHPG